jgi:hypothetical protein
MELAPSETPMQLNLFRRFTKKLNQMILIV